MTFHSSRSGFTLIEVLMVVVLVAIISVASIDLFTDTLNESKHQDTVTKMQQISNAIMGDQNLRENGARTSFGFNGDIGAIPTAGQTLSILVTNAGLPAWANNTTAIFGLGWNGPYLGGGNTATDYTKDAWGNAFVYAPAANPPSLTSYGSDGAAGGTGLAADIVVTFPTTQTKATTVTGYVTSHYTAYTGAVEVELNYPDGAGGLTQSLYTVVAPTGFFTFANVPFGTRSITAYKGSKAAPTLTVGPVLITIDKPNTVMPPNLLDLNP